MFMIPGHPWTIPTARGLFDLSEFCTNLTDLLPVRQVGATGPGIT